MLGGLALLVAPRGLTGKFQLGFASVFRWPLSIGRDFALTASTDKQLTDTVARREHNELQNHANNLEARLGQQQEEFRKLSDLYKKYDAWEGVDFVVADVITANIDRARSELTVAYGKGTGMARGQYVLGDNSIIGTISDFSSGTAHVKLFTDPTSKMPARISGVERIMQGNGANSAKILQLLKVHKIEVGDKVLASNNQVKFLEAPMIVGTVAQAKTSLKNPLLWDVTVKPACDIEKLENVAIIIMNPRK